MPGSTFSAHSPEMQVAASLFAGMLILAAVIGAIFYRLGLDSAVAAAHRTRESMLLRLSHSDAPLSVT